MAYPVRPQIPNPYQIIGQAVGQVGSEVRQFGKEQDELAERFRLMMEKRAQAQMEEARRKEELELKQNEDKRRQGEADAKAKRDADRAKFFSRQPGAQGQPAYTPIELQNALATGLIDPQEYKALEPKQPERFAAGGGYYEMGPDGKPRQIVAPPPREEKPPRGQVVQDANGNFVVVDPTTGTSTPVTGAGGAPLQGRGPGQLTGKQLENAKSKQAILASARMQLEQVKQKREQIRNSFSSGPFGMGKIPTEAGAAFDAAVDPLRVTLRSLTRTPGEGAMSDYESRLAQAQIPTRNAYESVTDQQIQQLEDLINLLQTGYEGMGATRGEIPGALGKPDFRKKYNY